MEAPAKIFLHPDIGGREFIRPWLKRRVSQESVEYTHTDVFVEKASEWLSKHASKYFLDGPKFLGTEELVEDFKIAMKL